MLRDKLRTSLVSGEITVAELEALRAQAKHAGFAASEMKMIDNRISLAKAHLGNADGVLVLWLSACLLTIAVLCCVHHMTALADAINKQDHALLKTAVDASERIINAQYGMLPEDPLLAQARGLLKVFDARSLL